MYLLQLVNKLIPGGVAHGYRHTPAVTLMFRQGLGLLVTDLLQNVLHPAQIVVTDRECSVFLIGENIMLMQCP